MDSAAFIKRFKLAVSKIIFCVRISAGLGSFFKLLVHAKRFSSNRYRLNKFQNSSAAFAIKIRSGKFSKEIWLRTYSGDVDIFFENFWKMVYFVPAISEAKYIVDLGANIGMSMHFFLKCYPDAQVVAVEPDLSNYSLLTKNCEKEIVSKKVYVVHGAVFPIDTTMYLKKSTMAYNSYTTFDKDTSELVQALSMNTLLQNFALSEIDILKIDIEDAEKDLFSANTEWLNCVRNIIIEVHSQPSNNIFSAAVLKYGFEIKKLNVSDSDATILWAHKKDGLFL